MLQTGIAATHHRIMRRRPCLSIIRESASAPRAESEIHANRRAMAAPSRLKLVPIHGAATEIIEAAKPW